MVVQFELFVNNRALSDHHNGRYNIYIYIYKKKNTNDKSKIEKEGSSVLLRRVQNYQFSESIEEMSLQNEIQANQMSAIMATMEKQGGELNTREFRRKGTQYNHNANGEGYCGSDVSF